jgi:hypothetical protein
VTAACLRNSMTLSLVIIFAPPNPASMLAVWVEYAGLLAPQPLLDVGIHGIGERMLKANHGVALG